MGILDWIFGKRYGSGEALSGTNDHEPGRFRWTTSESGNAVALAGDRRITIFEQDGGWKFCLADARRDDQNPYYSDKYGTRSAAEYEALAIVEGRESRYQSTRQMAAERASTSSDDYVESRRMVLRDVKKALEAKPATLIELRKLERKVEAGRKHLPRLRDDLYIAGENVRVAHIDRLIAEFRIQAESIASQIIVAKARPRQ